MWQDQATENESDNFNFDFKLGDSDNYNPKDGDESHIEFEGGLYGNGANAFFQHLMMKIINY